MTDFIVTITAQSQLDGITYAREQYNAGLPSEAVGALNAGLKDDKYKGSIATDQDYVTFVVMQAAASYARDRMKGKVDEAVVAADIGDLTKLDAVRAEYAAKSK